eukprot:NODE_14505_length_445_cov_42.475155_g14206_i0.p1 GENE.NODE_14505_length_445_cov_42.475155_g14206_i0~~NODE_14505_length_445_cov_42.475155_g14206_i0.p1  ORF type:complete len:107 (+),score=0.57 NODE_14505_length_445_cov_42.475155_g14206_i0:88-408(+)
MVNIPPHDATAAQPAAIQSASARVTKYPLHSLSLSLWIIVGKYIGSHSLISRQPALELKLYIVGTPSCPQAGGPAKGESAPWSILRGTDLGRFGGHVAGLRLAVTE